MNSGAGFGNLLVLALPLLLLAFLMLTQRKRGREVQAFQSALSVGVKCRPAVSGMPIAISIGWRRCGIRSPMRPEPYAQYLRQRKKRGASWIRTRSGVHAVITRARASVSSRIERML